MASRDPVIDPHARPDAAVLRKAAEWFAILRADHACDADRMQWQVWLEADPAHRAAWRQVEHIIGKLQGLPAAPARAGLAAPGRRHALKTLSLLLATGAIAWQTSRLAFWREWTADYRTGVGEIREVRLAEGTRVWLNTSSALNVTYGADLRRLTLFAGEVMVESAPDTVIPPRPLVIDTAEGRLRALGTRFSVRQADAASDVAVFDRAVAIRPLHAPMLPLQAGLQTRFTRDAIAAPEPADPNRQAWSRGMLIADNLRLGDLIAELARYQRGYLACAPEVKDLRVVGAYPLTDTDRVLAALEASLPVKVSAPLPWWVTIEAR